MRSSSNSNGKAIGAQRRSFFYALGRCDDQSIHRSFDLLIGCTCLRLPDTNQNPAPSIGLGVTAPAGVPNDPNTGAVN
jgi:hypothetical protein